MRALTVALLTAAAACRPGAAFECDSDLQCRARGAIGRCAPTGFCAFADTSCASGFRYADSAGGGHASTCLGAAETDAAVVDASTFDLASCPATFTLSSPAIPHAKFRAIATGPNRDDFAAALVDCASSITHTVAADTVAKRDALVEMLGLEAEHHVFVGAVQGPGTTTDESWIHFVGSAVAPELWNAAESEPDDGNGDEADHAEQFAAITRDGLRDVRSTGGYTLLCECDGRQTTQLAVTYIQAAL